MMKEFMQIKWQCFLWAMFICCMVNAKSLQVVSGNWFPSLKCNSGSFHYLCIMGLWDVFYQAFHATGKKMSLSPGLFGESWTVWSWSCWLRYMQWQQNGCHCVHWHCQTHWRSPWVKGTLGKVPSPITWLLKSESAILPMQTWKPPI